MEDPRATRGHADSRGRPRTTRLHVLGTVAGALLAVLVLRMAEGSSPGSGSQPAPPPPAPVAFDDGDPGRTGPPTHVGHGSDGAWVFLWAEEWQWRWEVVAAHPGRCGSGEVAASFGTTRVWGPPIVANRFLRSDEFTEPIRLEGRPGSDRVRLRLAARRGRGGNVRGTFSRADVFSGDGVASRTCRQGFRFVLTPR